MQLCALPWPLLTCRFKSYSKFPPCYKDVAFWVSEQFTENNLCEVVRGIAGDLAEEVKLIDEFNNPKTVSRAGGVRGPWARASQVSGQQTALRAGCCCWTSGACPQTPPACPPGRPLVLCRVARATATGSPTAAWSGR